MLPLHEVNHSLIRFSRHTVIVVSLDGAVDLSLSQRICRESVVVDDQTSYQEAMGQNLM